MKASKFFKPYFEQSGKLKCSLKNTFENKVGVYLIKNSAGEIVYVGSSTSNLYKTLYRHFQSWKDAKQFRATYPKTGYEIRVITTTEKQAERLEKFLIGKLKPVDCLIKYKKYFESEEVKPEFKITKIEPIEKKDLLDNDCPF